MTRPKEFRVEDYNLSYHTGCLMENPLATLPEYFEPWNCLAKSFSKFIKDKCLRDEVHKLPVLDHTKLKGYRQFRLAHLQLSFITAGYVWQEGDKGVVKILPKCIALPFYHISKELGVQPILSHIDLVLSNFTLTDCNEPWDLTNIDCHYRLPGEEEGKWFATVTMLVELEFAKCLKPMEKVVNLIEECETAKEEVWQYYIMQDIVGHLNYICQCIEDMREAIAHMHEKLSAKTFFNVLRPFLGGWGGEGNILPEGLIYEGVSDEPMQFAGGSAAQSTTLQALDVFFGVSHSGERKEFLLSMRKSMPPDHVRFLEDLEQYSHLLSYVEEMAVPGLTKAYNKCIKSLLDFRSYHIGIVTKYIISAARIGNEGNYKSLDEKGTGGTDLIPFLKGLVENTQKKIKGDMKNDLQNGNRKRLTRNGGSGRVSLLLGLAFSGLFVFALCRKSMS